MTNWVTFIGPGRCGHTIVAAIIDSHPNARVSEEIKIITKWARDGWTREKILDHTKNRGRGGKERRTKLLPGHSNWEAPLLVLGDKCGWDAPMLIKHGSNEDILDKFSEHIGMPVKVVHTIRNPYDIITGWVQSSKWQKLYGKDYMLWRMAVRRYARFYSSANKIVERYPRFDLYNEELIQSPERVLTELCEFLELPIVEPWFTNAVNAVYKKPNERSKTCKWPAVWEEQIPWRIIDKYSFLERYRK